MTTIAEPRVLLHRTKGAGYQVIHVSSRGTRTVRGRNLEYADALSLAAAYAKTCKCQIEVDR